MIPSSTIKKTASTEEGVTTASTLPYNVRTLLQIFSPWALMLSSNPVSHSQIYSLTRSMQFPCPPHFLPMQSSIFLHAGGDVSSPFAWHVSSNSVIVFSGEIGSLLEGVASTAK